MKFDDWSLPKRAVALNLVGTLGIGIGFLTGTNLPPGYYAYIGVFTLAFLNFMFLAARPRIISSRADGSIWKAMLSLVREQPFVIALVLLQLIGTSRSASASVKFLVSSGSEYVHSLPNAASVANRMVLTCALMAVVSLIWLASAVGIWQRRSWAWWLALLLNGLAGGVSAVLQIRNRQTYLLDGFATAALILLSFPSVRRTAETRFPRLA